MVLVDSRARDENPLLTIAYASVPPPSARLRVNVTRAAFQKRSGWSAGVGIQMSGGIVFTVYEAVYPLVDPLF